MEQPRTKVVFVGLGAMGGGLVRRLHDQQTQFPCSLLLCDKDNAAARKCSKELSSSASFLPFEQLSKLLVEHSPDFLCSCLPNSTVVMQLFDSLNRPQENNAKRKTIWIDFTSGNPLVTAELSRRCSQELSSVGFVDAAMSGGPKGARNGTLTLMVGGDEEDVQRATPLLSCLSSKLVHAGLNAGSGHAIKAMNNALMAMNVWGVGEALLTLAKMGVDPKVALDALNNSSGRSWATMQRFPEHVLTGTFDYGFRLDLCQKDIKNALKTASQVGVYAPIFQRVRELFDQAAAKLPDPSSSDHLDVVRIQQQWANLSLSSCPASSPSLCPPVSEMGIKLAVFDCAGTVVDEGAIVYQTLIRVLEADNVPVDPEEFNKWHGANKVEVIRYFIYQQEGGKKNGEEGQKMEERIQRVYKEFMTGIEQAYFAPENKGVVKVMNGAVELMDKLRAAGIKVALNTGYPRHVADGLISMLDLSSHIDGSIVAEEVGKGRPYPYMIQSLMRKLDILEARTVMKVGDTARDVEEGRNAGCGLVVGVLSGADDGEVLVEAGADLVLPSVADIRV
ncbi:PhnX protein [Balamuthia mandrillaris]